MQGVSEKNFFKLKEVFLKALILGSRRNLLLSPSHHLKFGLLRVSQQQVNKWYANLYNDIFQMAKVGNYNDFAVLFHRASASMARENEQISDIAKNVQEVMRKKIDTEKKKRTIRWFLSTSGWQLFFQLVYPDILRQFNLQNDVGDMERDEVVRRIPSLVQWTDAFRKSLYRRILEGYAVRSGDYFDIQKVVYLDLCDYIVSDDGDFRKTLDMPGPTDLHGRVIKLEKFLRHLDGLPLLKRLTNPIYDDAYGVAISFDSL